MCGQLLDKLSTSLVFQSRELHLLSYLISTIENYASYSLSSIWSPQASPLMFQLVLHITGTALVRPYWYRKKSVAPGSHLVLQAVRAGAKRPRENKANKRIAITGLDSVMFIQTVGTEGGKHAQGLYITGDEEVSETKEAGMQAGNWFAAVELLQTGHLQIFLPHPHSPRTNLTYLFINLFCSISLHQTHCLCLIHASAESNISTHIVRALDYRKVFPRSCDGCSLKKVFQQRSRRTRAVFTDKICVFFSHGATLT